MSAISQMTEPTHDHPCWVLTYKGVRNGISLALTEYVWAGETWRPSGNRERPRSLYKALEKADWVGHLPKQGRRRTAFNGANLARVRELREEGKSRPEIERETGLSHAVVHRLWHY